MRHLLACILFLSAAAVAENKPEAWVHEKFPSGGTIRMHVGAGGYTISGTDSETISITYTCRTSGKLKAVRARIKVDNSVADVWLQNTPHDDFEATVEVPRRSNLWVRLPAGEVNISDVEGDKDVESLAGEINIEIAHPEEYGRRDASVVAGDVEASAFDVSKGGLFRSFKQRGSGKYRLHAHILAGEINYRGPE